MYPIGRRYNDADIKASYFNRARGLQFTQTAVLYASTSPRNTPPPPPPSPPPPVSINSGVSSPLSNIYVPNMPIQASGSGYHSCSDWGTINMSTNAAHYSHLTNIRTPLNSSFSTNHQRSLWNNYRTQYFSQNGVPSNQNGRYYNLPTYENSNNMNMHARMDYFPFNQSKQATIPRATRFVPQNNPMQYSQVNQRYQHFLTNECRSYPIPKITHQQKYHKVAHQCNPSVCTHEQKGSHNPVPVVKSPEIVVVLDQQTEENHEHGKNISAASDSSLATNGNKASIDSPKKNEFLVSLPGGIPLFSIPLNNPISTKKRRGRPPKPKPPPHDPPPSKLRYKRGKSHLKLLQNAPNSVPCVSTLETFRNFKSNASIDEPQQPCSSSSIQLHRTDADVEVIGSFPCGKTRLEKSSFKRNATHVSAGCSSTTTTSLSNANAPITNEVLIPVDCSKKITDNDLSCNPKNRATAIEKNDIAFGSSFTSINLGGDIELETCTEKRKRDMSVNKCSTMMTRVEKVNLPKKRGCRKKKDELNRINSSQELHNSPTQEIITTEFAVNTQTHENLTPTTTSKMLNESKIVTETQIITTNSCAINEPKCLNMPDIFGLLQDSNESDHTRREDAAETENILELEEMISMHANSETPINTSPTPNNQDQAQMKNISAAQIASSAYNYFPSFLSDDSDSDEDSTMSKNNAQIVPNEDLQATTSNSNLSVGRQRSQDKIQNSISVNESSMTSDYSFAVNNNESLPRQNCFSLNNPITTKLANKINRNFEHGLEISAPADTIGLNSTNLRPPIFGLGAEKNNITIAAGEMSRGHSSDPITMRSDLLSDAESPIDNNMLNSKISTACSFMSLWQEFIAFMETESDDTRPKKVLQLMQHKKATNKTFVSINHQIPKTSAFVGVLPRTVQKMSNESNKREQGSREQTKEIQDNVDCNDILMSLPSDVAPSLSVFAKTCRSKITSKPPSQTILHHVSPRTWQVLPTSFQLSPPYDCVHPLPPCSKTLFEEKGKLNQISCTEKYNKITTSVSSGDDSRTRKNEYDQMGNRVVKRRAHRVQVPKDLDPKRKILAHTFEKSNLKRKRVTQIKNTRKPRSRTTAMIKKLIKFTNTRQNGNLAVNETKSKLNAELDKVFLLGNNPVKRKFSGSEKLKEVLLEIPGPMERRPKMRKKSLEKENGDDKSTQNTKSHQKTTGAEKMIPPVISIEPQQPIKNLIPLNLSLSSESSEDEKSFQHCLPNSTNKFSDTTTCQPQQISKRQENTSGESEGSVKVHNVEANDLDDDDDTDILDIHAERDSLLDMFC